MSKRLQAVRGMNDLLPENAHYWQHVEGALRHLACCYGYNEIRLPIVEPTELFCRSIGDVTDIVEKEMYTFEDRNKDSLSLRPEGTAGCVRAGIQHGILYNQTQKFWYMGPMFRHERPQKGRYRQFHQFGLEAFGFEGPDIDAEMILFTARLWHQLGLQDHLSLQINSLGDKAERQAHREQLIAYLQQHHEALDEDSKRRLNMNPLRILDSKNPAMAKIIADAPSLLDCLEVDSRLHFEGLRELLDAAKINYDINPCLVRGLDYYSKTVFEWVTTDLGAQGTVCAGGRFDVLVEQLGGQATPALGFALGLERLVALLEQHCPHTVPMHRASIYLITDGEAAMKKGILIAEDIRTHFPKLGVNLHCGGGSFRSKFKRADKSGAKAAMIIGEDEIANDTVSIKFLREDKQQLVVEADQLQQVLISLTE